LTEIERGPQLRVIALLFQLAHSIAVLKAARPRMARRPLALARLRRSAIVDQQADRPCDSTSATPSLPHHKVRGGCPRRPCTPRTAEIERRAPASSRSKCGRPSRSRRLEPPSPAKPESCSSRAATRARHAGRRPRSRAQGLPAPIGPRGAHDSTRSGRLLHVVEQSSRPRPARPRDGRLPRPRHKPAARMAGRAAAPAWTPGHRVLDQRLHLEGAARPWRWRHGGRDRGTVFRAAPGSR